MYEQKDWENINRIIRRRWIAAVIPAVIVMILAVVIFVYGQLNRSDVLWFVTSVLTILGGGYFLLAYGVAVRPALIYRRHLQYMMAGRMRETTGVFKFFSEDVSDRDGLECHAMLLNVGEKDDPEDDRLFYYDVYKDRPAFQLGQRVTVRSNDKMVSSIEAA